MHNLKFKKSDAAKSLDSVKFRTGARKQKFITDNSKKLIALHEDYNNKADQSLLNTLKPVWTNPGKKEDNKEHDYWISYDLYSSGLTYVSDYWDCLKSLNGDRTLRCPICGLSDCREMDHYAPRSLFPEYSCHLPNLIPLCHNCNNDKGDGWLDRNGQQIYFNAFFDTDIPESIVDCSFEIKGDLIKANLSLSSTLIETNTIHSRIVSTIGELELLPKFQEEADKVLNRQVRDIRYRYKEEGTKYKDVNEFIDYTYRVIVL